MSPINCLEFLRLDSLYETTWIISIACIGKHQNFAKTGYFFFMKQVGLRKLYFFLKQAMQASNFEKIPVIK